MNRFFALLAFAASLYGCDLGTVTTVQRIADGVHALDSRVVARPGRARFDCLASSDGICRYTLYRRDCASAPGHGAGCPATPLAAFDLASGGHREVTGLPPFRICVQGTTPVLQAGCEATPALAAR